MPVATLPYRPVTVPQVSDETLNALRELEGERPDFSGGDEAPPPRRQSRQWRPPQGRLVRDAGGGVLPAEDDESERPKPVRPDPNEIPDKTGGIADAGFIDD